ncbi:hypothetical protein FG386_000845 [Cryptosporidium ryanae]|uniref:uncharacterized protein n=1 Tax=Cryptosporidium ryanae TaxID=515981 RepID=UPI00351AAD58|nr:hypothetical protein FG386_000845 [Cryptosporidium ryanae]
MNQLSVIFLFCLSFVISIKPEYDILSSIELSNVNVTYNYTQNGLKDILNKINDDKKKLNYTIESLEFNKTLNSIATKPTTNITRGLLGFSEDYNTIFNTSLSGVNNQTNNEILPTRSELLIS